MFRKSFFTFLLAAVLLSLAAAGTFAQGSPVRGEIKVQKADGTTAPVAGALVEAYRTDIDRGKMPSTKSNKRGEFSFVSFPLGQRFALSVSGPGIAPIVYPEVKAGMENLVITVSEGDGRVLSEQEARSVAKQTGSDAPQESEEDRKARAELEKKNAEIQAKNEKIKASDDIARRANQEGRAALDAKNWDVALAKFDEGITAVPDFVGSTPILIAGKMIALRQRGYIHYVEGARSTDVNARLAKYGLAKKEFHDALAAYAQAIDVLKKAEPATEAKDQQLRKSIMNDLYGNVIETHRLMAVSQVDTSKTGDAEVILKEYIAIETDPAKKMAAQVTLGDIMRAAGEFDKAVAAYRAVLETAPDNTEVMASLGLSLVAQGTSVDPPNREQLQEGLNYMQKYADTVAVLPTDPPTVQEFKKSVKETVEYLKTEQKLKAQPTQRAAPKRRG